MSDGTSYTAKKGDCVSSIAKKKGLFWETIWNDPNNKQIKDLRKDPNVLMAGDVLFIPNLRQNEIECGTEEKHRFRLKGVPAKARYQFKDEEGEPIANIAYTIDIDGSVTDGTTDGDGRIELAIPPDARKGVLTLKDGDFEETYELQLGDMDPVNEESGARKRLNNLGYECDKDDKEALDKALREFQADNDLEVTGKLDDASQEELLKQHGC
jgi:hypothetical protein